jgi:transposase
MRHTGTIPGKKRDRLLLWYDYLDQLGLSEEVEQVTYHGSTSRLSARQKLLGATQQRG